MIDQQCAHVVALERVSTGVQHGHLERRELRREYTQLVDRAARERRLLPALAERQAVEPVEAREREPKRQHRLRQPVAAGLELDWRAVDIRARRRALWRSRRK